MKDLRKTKPQKSGLSRGLHISVVISLLPPAALSLPSLIGSPNTSAITSAINGGGSTVGASVGPGERASASIEQVVAKLVPFDMEGLSGPLSPIAASGGLVFQYSPSISETIEVDYNSVGSIVHSNENYNVWSGTQNRRISLGDVVFTADTEENATYLVAAMQFFRVYSLSDFGRGKTGRPPSPMWFSAYGRMMYEQVPVLLKGATLEFPNNVDYVRVPTSGFASSTQANTATGITSVRDPSALVRSVTGSQRDSDGDYVWVPAKMVVSGISLIVQHSPNYWKETFSLADFKSGGMLERRETSPIRSSVGAVAASSSTVPTGTSQLGLLEALKRTAAGVAGSGSAAAGALINADKPVVNSLPVTTPRRNRVTPFAL